MKFDLLEQLFLERHPGGAIRRKGRRVQVRFCPQGQVYTYSGTLIEIAEKLSLIPEVDVPQEARRVLQELLNSPGNVVRAITGLADEIRILLDKSYSICQEINGVDRFGRSMSNYWLIPREDDPWVNF